jgi:hypothetical protein
MKTIVVVWVPARDAGPSAEKAVAQPNLDGFQSPLSPAIRITKGGIESPKRDQSPPPFWTWFIENPRGRGAA